ncbi:MAG: hypothetical protein HON70_25065 [Lentisphaerae bacterium]|nr:hypothetical protein [Lentisphaerota bacterium]
MTEIVGVYAVAAQTIAVLRRQQRLALDQEEEALSLGNTLRNRFAHDGSRVA